MGSFGTEGNKQRWRSTGTTMEGDYCLPRDDGPGRDGLRTGHCPVCNGEAQSITDPEGSTGLREVAPCGCLFHETPWEELDRDLKAERVLTVMPRYAFVDPEDLSWRVAAPVEEVGAALEHAKLRGGCRQPNYEGTEWVLAVHMYEWHERDGVVLNHRLPFTRGADAEAADLPAPPAARAAADDGGGDGDGDPHPAAAPGATVGWVK